MKVTKVCCRCNLEKPIIEFGKDKNSSDGFTYACKECRNLINKKYRKDNPEKIKERNLKLKQYRKDFYQSDKGIKSSRRSHLKSRFNITLEDYDELLIKHNNKCAICGEEEMCKRNKFLCVDHNHDTNKIRGLLCNTCNRALGLFKDKVENLEKAITYLTTNN